MRGWSETQEPARAVVALMSKAKVAEDEMMRLSHERWRIIDLFFCSDRFLEAGSRGLRDLLLCDKELVFDALLAKLAL
jgi:hypothetical protein